MVLIHTRRWIIASGPLMFIYNNMRFGKAYSRLFTEGAGSTVTELTPAEEQAIPWADVTTEGFFVGAELFVTFPHTDLSARFTRAGSAWLKPVYDREAAVLMGLHSRLGRASPLRMLDDNTARCIITQTLL